MVDNKSKDESSAVRSTHVFDTVKENFVRTVDEMAKVQPQYSQAFSNLQLDFIQTTKNIIQNTISSQKQLVGSWNNTVSTPYAEHFTRQTNEITNNTLRAVGITNNRTVDAVTEFGTNIAKTCTAFSAAAQQQQQQFAKQ
ncbi:MAG: hypothetical protein K0S67_1732 [Nitrososphaeraceae archaeon]|nr:hypothetical protein [Nitrososphaeraceae archaeon]